MMMMMIIAFKTRHKSYSVSEAYNTQTVSLQKSRSLHQNVFPENDSKLHVKISFLF